MPFYKVPSTSTSSDLQKAALTGSRSMISSVDSSMFASDGCSDGGGSLTDLSEVDQDSELQRRQLDQKILRNQRQHATGNQNDKNNGTITNGGQQENRAKSAIEQELIAQHHREQELAAMRHLLSPVGSSSSWSVDSEVVSNGGDRGGDVEGGPPHAVTTNRELAAEEEGSQYAHVGESRIARELREQQERELELRGRWKQMGFVVPEEDDNNHSQTPFTLPQPVSDKSLNSGDRPSGKQVNASSFNRPTSHEFLDSNNCGSNSRFVPLETVANSNTDESADNGGTINDVGVDRRFVYTPEDETPIEREIRLAKAREQELRLERGLPSGGTNVDELDNRRRFDVDAEPSSDNGHHYAHATGHVGGMRQTREPSEKVTMKKLANGRLQMELNKEKQRELELKKRGMIHTTSEDRIGSTGVKYVDIITERNNTGGAGGGGATPVDPPRNFRGPDRVGKVSSVTHEEPKTSVAAPNSAQKSVTKSNDMHNTVAPELLQRFADKSASFADSSNGTGGHLMKCKPGSRPSATENKIQRELQEMLRREEELRLRQRSTDYSDIPEDEETQAHAGVRFSWDYSALADNDVTKNGCTNSDDVMKNGHTNKDDVPVQRNNKNALIAQWENKVEQS